jgi:cytidyltransferase-like protein
MKVVVFGVFDLFHPGHEYFLTQALEYASGDRHNVHVVLTTAEIVQKLKNKTPRDVYSIRKSNLVDWGIPETNVFESDSELGTYTVFQRINPDIVCFGYDQNGLQQDLTTRIQAGTVKVNSEIKLVVIPAFCTDVYKTSILMGQSHST